MLANALPYLRCPHCGTDLTRTDDTVRCAGRHTFDVARQGYLSLLTGTPRAGTGDTAPMVSARHDFLGAGHYSPVAEALAESATRYAGHGCVLDLGAGTGYYLTAVLDALPGRVGVAMDVSRYALRRSARAHPLLAAIGADTWQPLPVHTGAAGLVLTVFAPRNGTEIRRALAADGALLLVTPTPRHLTELVPALGLVRVDAEKQERLDRALGADLTHVTTTRHEYPLRLDHHDVVTVVGMGPSARHLTPDALNERIAALPDPLTVTVSVDLSVYRPQPRGGHPEQQISTSMANLERHPRQFPS
ncbi:MAG: 23S rRNA methyltransferase [Actinocatenispora sp.]